MGLYIKHETEGAIDNRNVVCNAFSRQWYGNSVYVLGDMNNEYKTFYISEDHERFHVDNITKYDFVTGLEDDGTPYLDVTFTSIDPWLIDNNILIGVEADICKNSKKGKTNTYGRLLIGNLVNNPRNETENVCWMKCENIEIGTPHRLYIRTRYYPKFYKNFCGGGDTPYKGRKYDDWKITIGVRVRFFETITPYVEHTSITNNYMLKDFKNYKTISYLEQNES